MNTEIIVHPKLHHYGLITANLKDMIDWYQKVLGMTINQHAKIPSIARLMRQGPPFSAFSFVSNDEMDHRIVFFEVPKAALDPDKRHHTGLQHVAFECETVDELLGTYLRLKDLGIEPLWAADHGVTISIYYQDPDRNVVEIDVNNYGSPQAATEYLRSARPGVPAQIDPEKLVAAQGRRLGFGFAQRAMAGEFAPAKPYDPGASFEFGTHLFIIGGSPVAIRNALLAFRRLVCYGRAAYDE